MRNKSWVWPEVGMVVTGNAGPVPLKSAQMSGQLKKSLLI